MFWDEIFEYLHWLALIENKNKIYEQKCANGEYYQI